MGNIPINVGDTQNVKYAITGASGYCDFTLNKHASFQIRKNNNIYRIRYKMFLKVLFLKEIN